MNSLQESITKEYHEKFVKVNQLIENMIQLSSMQNQNNILLAFKQVQDQNQLVVPEEYSDNIKKKIIKYYGTEKEKNIKEEIKNQSITLSDISLENYYSIAGNKTNANGYLSTLEFFQDLIQISETLFEKKKKIPRQQQKGQLTKILKKELQKINKHLPAAVYIPFVTNSIRNYAVLNIIVEESKVFCTKERAPFQLCFEIYRPEEDFEEERKENVAKKQRLQKLLNFKQLFSRKSNKEKKQQLQNPTDLRLSIAVTYKGHQNKRQRAASISTGKKAPINELIAHSRYNQSFAHFDKITFQQSRISLPIQAIQPIPQRNSDETYKRQSNNMDYEEMKINRYEKGQQIITEESTIYFEQQEQENDIEQSSQRNESEVDKSGQDEEVNRNNSLNEALEQDENLKGKKSSKADLTQQQAKQIASANYIFGVDSETKQKQNRENSPYKNFKTWKTIDLIIKSGDNLKQEQFGMQLLSQFEQIFKLEKVNVKVTTYEILSLGPTFGLIQLVKDAITIGDLKEKLHKCCNKLISLNTFFEVYYGKKINTARINFCKSLAGYCLITYFLQIKDRHNGNILLHKDGSLIHIDFGFLLSNAPGKGLEFEKPVPFKFPNEYAQVLKGRNSRLFQSFRKLFFKAFKAILKHKQKILILVQMMYSGHGTKMPCFQAGEKAMDDLEKRFNPPIDDITDDKQLNIFAQNLINLSLDNFRTRWYDKFQYYFQGIFY